MKPQKRTTKTGAVRWVARYTDPTGKERSKSFNTQREAKAFIQEQERAIRRSEWIAPTDITVADLTQDRINQARTPSTRNNRTTLKNNLGDLADMLIMEVKPAHIRTWLTQLADGRPWANNTGLADSTIASLAAILHGIFTQAINDDLITRHPMRGVPLPRVTISADRARIPTIEDINLLITTALGTGIGRAPNPTTAAMIQVGAETGLRAGELCGLRVRNVDFLRKELHIVEQIDQRTRTFAPLKTASSRRVVPIGQSTVDVIEAQLQRHPRNPDETVFCSKEGKPLSSGDVGARFRTVAKACGLDVTFHGLRHFYASALIDSGASVVMVQRALGHASASMTLNIYSHLFPGAGDQLRSKLPTVRDFSGISGKNDTDSNGVDAG